MGKKNIRKEELRYSYLRKTKIRPLEILKFDLVKGQNELILPDTKKIARKFADTEFEDSNKYTKIKLDKSLIKKQESEDFFSLNLKKNIRKEELRYSYLRKTKIRPLEILKFDLVKGQHELILPDTKKIARKFADTE